MRSPATRPPRLGPSLCVLASLASLAGCAGTARLEAFDPDVPVAEIRRAGRGDRRDDPALDAPLAALLERRLRGGWTALDDERTIQTIRVLERRGSTSARPLLEKLIYDPAGAVQAYACAALESVGDARSLAPLAGAATTGVHADQREMPWHALTRISGERIPYLDHEALRRAVLDHAPPP